jgi:peroxiredoxin
MKHQTLEELNEACTSHREEHIAKAALVVMEENAAPSATRPPSPALQAGVVAPDFLLPDAQGEPVHLRSILKKGPAILVFYRGGWCAHSNIYLRGLQRSLPEIERLGAQILAISPQLPEYSLATQMGNGLDFPVLSDVGNKVASLFGVGVRVGAPLLRLYESFGHPLLRVNGREGERELPAPAAFVIDSNGVIQDSHVDDDYPHSLDPVDLIAAVESLRRRRPAKERSSALDLYLAAYSHWRGAA